jgi:nucleotide-binding universal stress UspA family protein
VNRTTRLVIGVGVLIVLVASTALASQLPRDNSPRAPLAASPEAPEAPPTAEELAHASERLAAHGITASTDQLAALAQNYGLGGAVRLFAWSKSTGKSVDELRAMRDGGQGWGVIARELGVSPGIGSIMGGGNEAGADDEASSPAN